MESEAHEKLKRRRLARFIAGPFSWAQFCTASRLPGKSLSVWELIHHCKRVTRSTVVTLPNEMLEEADINEDAKGRALEALEQAGLITVERVAWPIATRISGRTEIAGGNRRWTMEQPDDAVTGDG